MELRSSSEKYLNKALPTNVSSAPNNDGLMKWLGLSVAHIVSLRSILTGSHCIPVVDGFANNWGVRVNKGPGLLNRISSDTVGTFMC